MAQAPHSSGGNDNFIRHIVTDPKNVPDVMLLTGYLGASSRRGPRAPIPQSGPLQLRRDPQGRHPASGASAEGTGRAWRCHGLGEEGRGAAIQDGSCRASLGELFRRRDSGRGAGRAPRRRGGSRTTRHHRGALRNLQLFASLPDRNHALHQHAREYLFLPRHACLPVAEPALPVAGRLHLRGVWSFACVHPRVALRRSCRRRPSRTRWHHRAHALSQHACGSVQPPPHRSLPIERLPVSQRVYTW